MLPIWLNQVNALINCGETAMTRADHCQTKGSAKAVETVSEVEGARQVAGDDRVKAIGDQQMPTRPHCVHHRCQQSEWIGHVLKNIGAHQYVNTLGLKL